jgi:hypothetical protein
VPWLRVDDTALVHPKVMRLRTLETDVVTAERVVGWVMLCATWSGQQLTDCWLPEAVGAVASPTGWRELAAAAVKVKMLRRHRRDGQDGWLVSIDDGLFHLMSKDEVERNREKRRSTRQDGPKIEVLLRDGDQCRYCAKTVNPKDNRGKSGRGREFDHPDPDDRDTFVVACTDCNGKKWQRTPEEAGMTLLPPPDPESRHFHPSTLEWLANRNAAPGSSQLPATGPQARPGSQPGDAATEREAVPAAAAPEREAPVADAARAREAGTADAARRTDQHQHHHQDRPPGPPAQDRHPGRDGPGRVGSVSPGTSPPRSRDGPRTRRGRRAGRGRAQPQDPCPAAEVDP